MVSARPWTWRAEAERVRAEQPETRALQPFDVECRCGATLRMALAWTVVRCGHCRLLHREAA